MTPLVLRTPSVEHLRDPLGIGTPRPRVSWVVERAPAEWGQAAYELQVEHGATVTRSGWIDGADSVLVAWPFAPLRAVLLECRRRGCSLVPRPFSPARWLGRSGQHQ